MYGNSSYPPGASLTSVGGLDGRAQAMLEAMLERERQPHFGGGFMAPQGPPLMQSVGPRKNTAGGRSVQKAEFRGSGQVNTFKDPGFQRMKWQGFGFNMTPGLTPDIIPNSAQMVSAPGPSPAGLTPGPLAPPRPEGPDERPDFYGLNSRFAAMMAAGQRQR